MGEESPWDQCVGMSSFKRIFGSSRQSGSGSRDKENLPKPQPWCRGKECERFKVMKDSCPKGNCLFVDPIPTIPPKDPSSDPG